MAAATVPRLTTIHRRSEAVGACNVTKSRPAGLGTKAVGPLPPLLRTSRPCRGSISSFARVSLPLLDVAIVRAEED